MRTPLFALLFTTLAVTVAAGEKRLLGIQDGARGSLAREVPAAVRRMMATGDTRLALGASSAKVECVDITEIPDVVVCVFNTARFMNFALNRASEWVEVSKKSVLSDHQHTENDLNFRVEGHDLRGADLRAFDQAWSKARTSFEPVEREDSLEVLRIERDFWEAVLRPRLKKTPDLIVLAVAAGTDIEGTLSHEILHAQYFRSKEMRRIVAEYWDASVSAADKDAVKSALRGTYAVDADPELLVNEFQAYVLMNGAESSQLASIAPAHRARLMTGLAASKIEPIQFRLPIP